MFTLLLNAYPKKELYKATINSSYNCILECCDNVKKQDMYPYMDSKKWDSLSEEQKNVYSKNAKEQHKLIKEMVSLVKLYCEQYPGEKICDYRFLKEYDEYPYRLEQNLPDFIKLL